MVSTFLIVIGLIFLEIATIFGSAAIITSKGFNSLLKVLESGYKFDLEKMKDFKFEDNNSLRKIIKFIPIINLLMTYIGSLKFEKTDILKELEMKDAIIPMTEEEKAIFNSLDSKTDKLLYLGVLLNHDKEEEFDTIDVKENSNDEIEETEVVEVKEDTQEDLNQNEKQVYDFENSNEELIEGQLEEYTSQEESGPVLRRKL